MELPMHSMFPCSPCEQNAQAPERAPVTVARNRLFPKGEGNVHCEDWRTPFRNRKNMIIAPLQRIADVGGGLLPVAGFRCATGQIGASGAIPEAHLDVQNLPTPLKSTDCQQSLLRYNEDSTIPTAAASV